MALVLLTLGWRGADWDSGCVAAQYRIDTWKTEQGLPQNSIKAILQTRNGYLWLGTRFGLVRFDGIGFRVFDRRTTPGMAGDTCRSMTEDLEGNVWMAEQRYVMRYRDLKWESFLPPGSQPNSSNWRLCPSRDGGVWLGASEGLYRFQGTNIARYTEAEGLRARWVFDVVEQPQSGRLWVASRAGIQQRDPATGKFSDYATFEDPLWGYPQCMLVDHRDGLWTAHRTGLVRWENGKPATVYTTREGLSDDVIDFLIEDRRQTLWAVGQAGGVRRLVNHRFEPPEWESQIAGDQALCLYEDAEDNLWLGTDFGGLKRIQRRQMATWSARDGLLEGAVLSISEGRDGALFFGMAGGVCRFRDGHFTRTPLPSTYRPNQVSTVLEDRAGTVWVGTRRTGLHRLVDGQLTPFPLTGDLEADQVNALYEDRAGRLWIGSRVQLFCRQGQQVLPWPNTDGVTNLNVRGILEDRDGALWFATYGSGVNRLRDGKLTAFTTRHGLADDLAWVLHEDAQGALWVGTEKGLSRFKDGRIFSFTAKHGLFDEVINGLLEDAAHNFWIGCNRGIYRVAKDELDQVAAGRLRTVRSSVYGTADGMISSETNGENQPAACRDRHGTFWFPTVKGAVHFDPASIRDNPLPPPVVIEEVVMDHQPLPGTLAVNFAPGRGRVAEFNYSGNSLVAPEKVRFRYQLEGHDSEWVQAGTRRVAIYTNLRPGDYRFRVTACNNHGLWNPTAATFAFRLAPHFYQTWLFYGCCGTAVFALAGGWHWRRMHGLQGLHRLEHLHALDLERARIAQDMHDELGANLTTIGLLSELVQRDLDRPHEVQAHAAILLTASRELFGALDEIVWAVNPRHDTLDSLVAYLAKYTQDYLRLAGIRIRLELPGERLDQPVSSQDRHQLFLAVKEAVHNIVKHAQATDVRLRVNVVLLAVQIELADNGRGFDPAAVKAGRNGLVNMAQRLERLGGRMDVASAPGHGATMRFLVTLKPPLTH